MNATNAVTSDPLTHIPSSQKTISPQRLVTDFVAIAMLGRRVLLEGCTSLGRSDIFWMNFSGVPSLEKVPAFFTFFYS